MFNFFREEYAIRAYRGLNGRYYAGKQIYCYFTHVKNWKDAVCGNILCLIEIISIKN